MTDHFTIWILPLGRNGELYVYIHIPKNRTGEVPMVRTVANLLTLSKCSLRDSAKDYVGTQALREKSVNLNANTMIE
jgi:hypothetical protein